jgi:hypothetical protein
MSLLFLLNLVVMELYGKILLKALGKGNVKYGFSLLKMIVPLMKEKFYE